MNAQNAKETSERSADFSAVLLGTAVGDSIGLPAEGLSAKAIRRRWKGVWKQRLVFGKGMCSDDTEHTIFVAESLIKHSADPKKFQKALAWKLRFWLLGLPAGVGFATLRSIIKLWLGFPPSKSGVFSAGNGPAMRSAIIGAYFSDSPEKRKEFVKASTVLTHTDSKAFTAALAIAEIAAAICKEKKSGNPFSATHLLKSIDDNDYWQKIISRMARGVEQKTPVENFSKLMSLNGQTGEISGYAFHSVPVAIYAWILHRGNFSLSLETVLNCGGDTDTAGAIVGALSALDCGIESIPKDWINNIAEWPRSIEWMKKLSEQLAKSKDNTETKTPKIAWLFILPRNIFLLCIVLIHGFWRLFNLDMFRKSDRLTLEKIESIVNKMAKKIELSDSSKLPTYGYSEDGAQPHIEIDPDGRMHYVIVERGEERSRKSTYDINELLFWIFNSVTFSMAGDFELANRIEDQDFRIILFAKQEELMGKLNPAWEAELKKYHEKYLKRH